MTEGNLFFSDYKLIVPRVSMFSMEFIGAIGRLTPGVGHGMDYPPSPQAKERLMFTKAGPHISPVPAMTSFCHLVHLRSILPWYLVKSYQATL